jgi:hypothetical protein
MFVLRHLSNRLLSLAVSLILITLATLSVCPVLTASVADAHSCCKPRSGPGPASENSDCRAKCAASAATPVTPVLLNIGFFSLDQLSLAYTVAPRSVAVHAATPAFDPAAPQRPIYERTSALLI